MHRADIIFVQYGGSLEWKRIEISRAVEDRPVKKNFKRDTIRFRGGCDPPRIVAFRISERESSVTVRIDQLLFFSF